MLTKPEADMANQFASLKYQDMPFAMAPNLYSKFSVKKNFEKIERMHKDNLSCAEGRPLL